MKHNYLQSFIRYQVLYSLLWCIPSSLTKTPEAWYTFSTVLGIRYCIGYCSVSHHSLLRHMEHVLPFGIRYCIGYCNGSHHSLLRCMKHALPPVIYQVLGIVLAIIVYPFIPHQDTQSIVYLKYYVRYSVLYRLLQCVPSFLTQMQVACFTFSHLLGIRYCITYYNVSHLPSLRHTKHLVTSIRHQVLINKGD